MEAECKYCNWEENGDVADDRKDLIVADIKVPIEHTIKEKNLSVKAQVEVHAHLAIMCHECENTLELYVWDDVSGEEYLCCTWVKINYCPICGRKLESRSFWNKIEKETEEYLKKYLNSETNDSFPVV